MSCSGCMYLVGKTATCDQSYACNTSGERPKPKEEVKKKSKKSKE